MRIHDVIRTTAVELNRHGRHPDLEAILAQFPDIELGDDRAKWNAAQRIQDAFEAQEDEQRAK